MPLTKVVILVALVVAILVLARSAMK